MFDGFGVPVGDLALLRGLHGAGGVPEAQGGEGDTADDDESSGGLDEGVAGAVEGFDPLGGAHLLALIHGERLPLSRQGTRGGADEEGDAEAGRHGEGEARERPTRPIWHQIVPQDGYRGGGYADREERD